MSRRAEEGTTYPTSAFDYTLPRHLIARHPVARRDESRLLVVDRARDVLEHRTFRDLHELIPAGDVIVLNETRVMPARLLGRRRGGGEAEVLLLRPVPERGPGEWEALVRPGAKLEPGRSVEIATDLSVDVVDVIDEGVRIVRLRTPFPIDEAIARYGQVPLPPYIDRAAEPEDVERYQTVYARERGSVAAPTAGLHFTPELLQRLERSGVVVVRIVLHVGLGTFRPVEVENPAEHRLHEERYEVSADAAHAIEKARAAGGRVWAVGTTVVRTLESIAAEHGTVHAAKGSTSLFIRPPYHFRVIDRLITNFHLPRSTLLMLVAAFGGYDRIMHAYRVAVEREYRFYSYGDAMVVV
ncbi:MAG: tRNA preQ1(34) S-adenosylmethionine ribosyltransferase-isomerase QueA [Longimicrobiales bacterium]